MDNRGYFVYKGVDSRDMHLRIVNNISFPSPEADVQFAEVMGRDGELAINNKRLKGASFSIPVQLRLPKGKDINTIATEISNWLKSDIGWHPLRFGGSDEYEYIALCYQQFNVEETLKRYGKTVINFRLKPYKRRIKSKAIKLKNGATIMISEKRSSKPLISILADGNIDFTNNGKDWLKLRNVEGSITIDSEMMSAYKGDRPQYDKMMVMQPLFPVLEPGENKIEWVGARQTNYLAEEPPLVLDSPGTYGNISDGLYPTNEFIFFIGSLYDKPAVEMILSVEAKAETGLDLGGNPRIGIRMEYDYYDGTQFVRHTPTLDITNEIISDGQWHTYTTTFMMYATESISVCDWEIIGVQGRVTLRNPKIIAETEAEVTIEPREEAIL